MLWNQKRDGAVLMKLFEAGEADPNNTLTTSHMNMIRENNIQAFGHVNNKNFHKHYHSMATEYLAKVGQDGARVRAQAAGM